MIDHLSPFHSESQTEVDGDFAHRRSKVIDAGVTAVDVSIVVCTYNRASMLRQALQSLMQLETRDTFEYEILVVDNNSKDETQAVVAELARSCKVTLRTVIETAQGIVHARNRGVAEAKGEWIAFFDDDQLADKNWLLNLLALAREKEVLSVGGSVVLQLPAGETRQLYPTCRMLLGETVGMDEVQRYTPRCTPGAGNWMLHKSLFAQVGLFDVAYNQRGEDTDLFMRAHKAGLRAWYTPAAIVHHVTPAERLKPEYLMKLSDIMSVGMAEDERETWGPWRYPIVYAARVVQFTCVLNPRWLIARLSGNAEKLLGTQCRIRIARNGLRNGWRLIWTGLLPASKTRTDYVR